MMKEKILKKYNEFKLRNINYYKEAFQKSSFTFNWAACIFEQNWMIYRRMWLSALAYYIISGILGYGINSLYPNFECRNLLVCLVLMPITGFFGNSIYKAELKWKIKQGYHLSKDFNPTSLRSSISIILIAKVANVIMAAVSGFSGENFKSTVILPLLINLVIFGTAFCYEHHTYKNAEVEPKTENINQYLEKEGDDMSIIAAIGYYVLLALIIQFVAITSMRMIAKKITAQLTAIADEIDNKGKHPTLNIEEKVISDVNAAEENLEKGSKVD